MPHALASILPYRYLVLAPFAVVGGQMFAFVVGTLIRYGYFNPFIAYGVFVGADLFGDTAYYFFGRWGSDSRLAGRALRKIGVTREHLESLRALWAEHALKTMFVAKYALVFTGPLLISAGLVKLPVRQYYRSALTLTLLQYIVFMGLGYGLASAFGKVSDILHAIQIGAAIVGVFILYFVFAGRIRLSWLGIGVPSDSTYAQKNMPITGEPDV